MDKRTLIGSDPAMGRVAFKGGAILTSKDKAGNRKSKLAKKLLQQAKEG